MISFRLRAKWQNCRGYVPRYERTPKNGWFDIHSVFATHVETVVLLVHQKVDEYMYVDYEPQNADYLKRMQGTATYREIHDWVKEQYGVNVTNLNIAQVKDKCGFEKRENFNLGVEGHRVPRVTPEKEEMILEAFKHFRMI